MDGPTADFYRTHVESGAIHAEAARSAISKYFDAAFKKGERILDVGAGSGRDLAALCDDGFDAYGIEPNDAMRRFAHQRHPVLAARLQPGSLPIAGLPFGGGFDGLVCSAVLMHVPEGRLLTSCESMRAVLKPGGRLLLSLPFMRPELLVDGRDKDGRFFQNHSLAVLAAVLASRGFHRIGLDDAARVELPDVVWQIVLFESSVKPLAAPP